MVAHTSPNGVLVFHDPAYPRACAREALQELVPFPFEVCGADELAARLEAGCRLLISFQAPVFPEAAWPALLRFLEGGGHLALFGGMPFSRPVTEAGEVEPEQEAYTRQLSLGPFFRIEREEQEAAPQLQASQEALFLQGCPLEVASGRAGRFWACYPKLTQTSFYPEEIGSAGPLDTLLRPLIFAVAPVAQVEERIATPAFVLDQRSGRFRGGRWLLSLWEPAEERDWLALGEAIRRLIAFAAEGALVVDVRPTLACYREGEAPALLVTPGDGRELQMRIQVTAARSGARLQAFELAEPGSPLPYEKYLQLQPLSEPGLYRISVQYRAAGGQWLALENGFWIWDEALVEATRGRRLVAGRDAFYQDGQLFTVCGTTYMDSRVQRLYLRLPNPARWDRDMAEMRAAGINLLRTGIWTAWREVMPVAGVPTEQVLRALDAFVMTACVHDLQVIFTFFAFFPPLFDGENPWLDPRAVEAQERFIALLARRYARVELLSWDLINEPSFGDPRRAFAQRPLPNEDRFEVAAFADWLKERYSLEELRRRWRETPADLPSWEELRLPHEHDYATSVRDTTLRASLKVADYTRFSQEMFTRWAARMYRAIRAAGSQTLVGVGQDEAGARLAPQFYAAAVDYTTTHPWWNVEDLLWDMLLDKTLERPNLIQEIGVMLVRGLDGRPWRSEQANAWLLERKLITGLIARGAGLVQWLWHTNGGMTSDNENSIGLVRVDGSAKPELTVMRACARLLQALAGELLEPPTPEVWLVIPYGQWFARPELGSWPTQQAVRALAYELGVIPQLVGEAHLARLATLAEAGQAPRCVIVPALQLCDPAAWFALLDYVSRGGEVLVSGVIGRDLHLLPFDPRLEGADPGGDPVPVAAWEELRDAQGRVYRLTFSQEKIGCVSKAHQRLEVYRLGRGRLIWCGLPLELADEVPVIARLYRQLLPETPLEPSVGLGRRGRPLLIARRPLRQGTLILVVSEAGQRQELRLAEGRTIAVEAERAGALIVRAGQELQVSGGVMLLD